MKLIAPLVALYKELLTIRTKIEQSAISTCKDLRKLLDSSNGADLRELVDGWHNKSTGWDEDISTRIDQLVALRNELKLAHDPVHDKRLATASKMKADTMAWCSKESLGIARNHKDERRFHRG